MKTEIRISWLCIQRVMAIVATALLALFLYSVWSANRIVEIKEIIGTSPDISFELSPFMVDLGGDISVILPTLIIEDATSVSLDAVFSLTNPGRLIKKKIRWLVLSNNNDVWTAMDNFRSTFDSFEGAFHGGQYIIIVSLPANASRGLAGRNSEQIKSYLHNVLGSKLRAVQVVVKGEGTENGIPPIPKPEPSENNIIDETEDNKSVLAAEPEANQEQRDITTKQKGESDLVGNSEEAESRQAAEGVRQTNIPGIPYRQGARPISQEDVSKLRMDGRLPEIRYYFKSSEIRQLNLEQWKRICKQNSIPFVLVPSDSQVSEWPVLHADGELDMISSEDIRKNFGFELLPLNVFSEEIQNYVKDKIASETWGKFDEYRGFLLSDLLAKGVMKSFAEHDPPIVTGDIEKVDSISFSLKIAQDEFGNSVVEIVNARVFKK